MTKNLHIEHPEDAVLTGDVSVLRWLRTPSQVSMKIDGAPAIVWGTNPENGQFFVGTKSVFNKKKIMICYTEDDISKYYPNTGDFSKQGRLWSILQCCLRHLPRTEGIYQGDFIGFGGGSVYTPNTITYDFGEEVQASIIMAPHTEYLPSYPGAPINEHVSTPIIETFESDEDVMFVQPTVDCTERFADSVESIRKSVEKSKFLKPKVAKEVRIILNAFIREGKSISPQLLEQIVGDWTLTQSYFQVLDLKEQMMEAMKVYDGPEAYIGEHQVICEGFVRTNKYGSLKLVDRYQFAQANFNNVKFRSN